MGETRACLDRFRTVPYPILRGSQTRPQMLDSFTAASVDRELPIHLRPGAHIADILIAERGQGLVGSRAWPLLRPLLYRIFRYREAVALADAIGPLPATDAMRYLERLLDLDVRVSGAERIPRSGSFILAANHPTGIADGIAVYGALRPVRPDLAIFANRDAIRVSPALDEILIPVEWREAFRSATRTRETLRATGRAFADGRAVVIFPAGRIAYFDRGVLTERPWQPSAVSLARKYDVPVLPVHVAARNSALFYFLGNWGFTELRDMTVFHELLNKRGATFRVTFGAPIPVDALDGDLDAVTARLQDHCVHALARDPDGRFGA